MLTKSVLWLQISNVKDFIMIKDWKLVDLKVDNNPLIDKLTDYIGYVTWK